MLLLKTFKEFFSGSSGSLASSNNASSELTRSSGALSCFPVQPYMLSSVSFLPTELPMRENYLKIIGNLSNKGDDLSSLKLHCFLSLYRFDDFHNPVRCRNHIFYLNKLLYCVSIPASLAKVHRLYSVGIQYVRVAATT